MYKYSMQEAFVYLWKDSLTGKCYLGSHTGTLDDGYICSSVFVLEEYASRPNDFTREILAEGSHEEMKILELKMLQKIDAANDPVYYNRSNGTAKFWPCLGPRTEKTRQRISEAKTGKKRKPFSAETRKKMSEARKGKPHTSEWNAKISASCKGRVTSLETRKLISKAMVGNTNKRKRSSK